MKSQLRKHLWFSRTVFALSLGLLFPPTGCVNPSTPVTPISSSPSAPSSVSVTINPPAATVPVGGALSFLATAQGGYSGMVQWSVQEGTTGGAITSSGVYIAPNSLGTYHVVATSIDDPRASATAVVTIEPPTSAALGTFTGVGNMITARIYHTATLLPNGKVLIAGGEGGGFQALASVELYDPSTRTFAPTGSMITPRYAHSATLLADGRVLITGGISNNGITLYTAEIYDPSTGAFTATGDLTSIGGGSYSGAGTLLPDGRVLIAAANNAEIYDPHSGTFTPTGPYTDPTPISVSSVTLLTNGKVLVTGYWGPSPAGDYFALTELFDPQSGTFSATGAMVGWHSSALLADGRLLFLGSDYDSIADVEIYDPTTGTLTSVGSAIETMASAFATRLTDGTVLIAGGELPGRNGSTNAEIYVPASGTVEYAGQMTVGRQFLTATALPDNTVLLTGGCTFYPYATVQPLSSAEIYKPR